MPDLIIGRYTMRDEYDFTNAIKNPFVGEPNENYPHASIISENGIGMLKETTAHITDVKEIGESNEQVK